MTTIVRAEILHTPRDPFAALRNGPSAEATLGALFTPAREDCVAELRVAGEVVFAAGGGRPTGPGAARFSAPPAPSRR